MISAVRDASGNITEVWCIQDPFGNSYGYPTAGLATSTDQNKERPPAAQGNPPAARGYNKTTFDLWSTAGDRRKLWIKNWP
jgi:hypothetical protein